MIEAAIAAGLDGLVFTEHDIFWPSGELKGLRAKYPSLVILNGIEVSTDEGHLLVYGMTHRCLSDGYWSLPDLLDSTSDDGVYRAIAHPFRFDKDSDHFAFLAGMPMDGVEVASINTDRRGSRMAGELAEVGGFHRIASSDAHSVENVGRYYTVFEDSVCSESELVQALKARRSRPSHDKVVFTTVTS
jgi:predicted metal-dependent phosphoesterase TrpH